MKNEKIRFLLTGGLNTLAGYTIFTLLFFLINEENVALVSAYIFGILFNFKTYSKLVFTNSNKQIFINFIIIYITVFLFNICVLNIFTNVLSLNMYLSQLISIVGVTPILFLLNKKYVFIEEEFGI